MIEMFQQETRSDSDRGAMSIVIKSSDHFPYHIDYDWYVIYMTRVDGYNDKYEIVNNYIKNAPSNFTYINNELVLIYSDSDFYIKQNDHYLSLLKSSLEASITEIQKINIPPNHTKKIYRYEYCDGTIEKEVSNVFPPEIIPPCYQ
jgi:hypothetical protein